MLTRRVVKVSLTRTVEGDDGITAHAGTELWRVDWTQAAAGGKVVYLTMSHYTEGAARQHANNLLAQRASGLSIDAIYSENL